MKKQAIAQYRNIKGRHYIMHTSNPAEFEKCKEECAEKKITYRIINDQLYIEQI
jgi:hypothetical protein